MRSIRISKTFAGAFDELLAYGEPIYGNDVIGMKRAAVRSTLLRLAHYPRMKRPHAELGLIVYPVSDTPFVILYDFDDTELRVHIIFHKSASIADLDPKSAAW